MKIWITGCRNIILVGISLCIVNLIASEDLPEEPNGPIEPKEEVESVTPSSSSNANDVSISALDETKCMKSRNGCCDELFIGDEQSLMKCFALHQSKMPKDNENDPAKLMKFLSVCKSPS
ncbi:uncharacterized protein LOC119676973 [Teleopsis dalmanni]|uniref:uncharacterized protein LOC119676973 n=1 Tax=Teleopsis dalmanni TaxID=139649 RepID=UPI0018CD81BE|nr:uncharacterized protein LOC119676973 [Teleopsis dalmanni]